MKSIKETIVDHFIADRNRLLVRASLSTGNIPPDSITQIGDIDFKPSGTNADGLDFTASFQIGRTKVFYFGTISDDWHIDNEGVAGRSADGSLPRR